MAKIKSIDQLKKLKSEYSSKTENTSQIKVLVGVGTCGIAAGGKETLETIVEELEKQHLKNVSVIGVGCMGSCYAEPTVQVEVKGKESVLYGNVTTENAKKIVIEHLKNGKEMNEFKISKPTQTRIALRNCGLINSENINEYIFVDGYQALGKALTEMSQEQVIDVIKKSGLRGRGGGGFPTGIKWEAAKKYSADQKYVICNADEGDPGAFMDRSILEGDPHSVLEAMAIAGYAIGASKGIIYIRAEYPLAIEKLQNAIKQALDMGLLGENILGTGFKFEIALKYGAGAFVCGEETSLINSVQGNRGEPYNKPPFPAEKGLWGKPTIVNNVETYANIASIVLQGDEWFSKIGTQKSKGTKVFALAGKVKNVGLAEVPMGMTIREIIYNIGGGIKDNKKFKAVQTGGPSGGCIPEANLDTPIDYDNLLSIGSMMGSGGMIVMDEDNCMVDIAKFYLEFTMDESCGKCTACRVGNKRLYEILTRITEGKGTMQDLDDLKELGNIIKDSALCGLGQTSPNPVLSTLTHFYDEYVDHVEHKQCKPGVCKSLLKYEIDKGKCVGCTLCAKKCPVSCISGEVKKPHVIDKEKCIKCGVCQTVCKFNAVLRK